MIGVLLNVVYRPVHKNIIIITKECDRLIYNNVSACLHGGEGPQYGEVTLNLI